MSSILAATISFIACHGGPADHFATFTKALREKGHEVHVFAAGPAYKKMEDRGVQGVVSFSETQEGVAKEIAAQCNGVSLVITDVGHPLDVDLQEALRDLSPRVQRIAYYDNPEPFVPGGYSETAAKVMQASQKVLFANANLAKTGVCQGKEEEIGLGYYPLDQAEKIASRREKEQKALRARFLDQMGIQEKGQKIWVYAGGNNEEYFHKAFPAFLKFVSEASEEMENTLIVLQQHPGAKAKKIDEGLVQAWTQENQSGAKMVVAPLNSEDALVLADGVIYYQTSMGPQFVLAGLPTVHAGHQIFEDILVKGGLCRLATDSRGLAEALNEKGPSIKCDRKELEERLGIRVDWEKTLENLITRGCNG